MKLPRRQFLHIAASTAALPAVSRIARAQTYPTRPVTLIVPYPAGGGIDALARALREVLTRSLGQPIVIEDVGGAGGTIAMGRLARATPDGLVLGIGTVDQVVNGAIYQLQYDVVNAFEAIGLLANSPYLIVSKNAVPATNLKELITWLRANGGKIAQGHNGVGGGQHLCGINLQRAINVQWPFVPYRGAAPELQDLVGGQIDLLCSLAGSALPLARSGQIRPLRSDCGGAYGVGTGDSLSGRGWIARTVRLRMGRSAGTEGNGCRPKCGWNFARRNFRNIIVADQATRSNC